MVRKDFILLLITFVPWGFFLKKGTLGKGDRAGSHVMTVGDGKKDKGLYINCQRIPLPRRTKDEVVSVGTLLGLVPRAMSHRSLKTIHYGVTPVGVSSKNKGRVFKVKAMEWTTSWCRGQRRKVKSGIHSLDGWRTGHLLWVGFLCFGRRRVEWRSVFLLEEFAIIAE